MKKGFQVCAECGKKMERCKLATVRPETGAIGWVCRRCWKELDYVSFVEGREAE